MSRHSLKKISAFFYFSCTIVLLSGCSNSTKPDVASSDKSPDSITRIALAAHQSGDPQLAITLFKNGLAHHPDHGGLNLGFGKVLLAQQNYDDAIHAFKKALHSSRTKSEALKGLGKTQLSLNMPKIAYGYFQEAVTLRPKDKLALNGCGVSLDLQGKHALAEKSYRLALEIDPMDANIKSNLGLCLALGGKHAESIAQLKKITSQAGSTKKFRHNLAIAYGFSGDYKSAEKILSQDMEEDAVQHNLGYIRYIQSLKNPSERAASVMTKGITDTPAAS